MQRPVFSSSDLPHYHENRLLVRVKSGRDIARAMERPISDVRARSATVRYAAANVGAEAAQILESTAGLGAVEYYNRAGLIRTVTPLARNLSRSAPWVAEHEAGAVAASMVMAEFAPSPDNASGQIERGVSIVEVSENADVDRLSRELANDPNIAHVSRVPLRFLCAKKTKAKPSAKSGRSRATTPQAAPPSEESGMWNLRKIRWQEARLANSGLVVDSVEVAVLDSGIDMDHPDLRDQVDRYEWFGYLPGVSSDRDHIGHGTHVAGTVAATVGNRIGIAGVSNCRISAYKIFDDEPDYSARRGEFVYYVDTIMYLHSLLDCIDNNVQVVNLSIGGPGAPSAEEGRAFRALIENGTVVVAAMGNERAYGSPISYPAAIQDVIAVGATRPDDRVARFSNRGNHIALSAPGVAIWSTLPTYPGYSGFDAVIGRDGRPRIGRPHHREQDYDAWDGTSMATPHVAGAVSLLLAKHGRMSVDSVRDALTDSADAVPGMGGRPFHPDYGTGRLNLEALLM